MSEPIKGRRVFLCGTRAVLKLPDGTYRVVCATCGAGDSIKHILATTANRAAVRDSVKACSACGAA